MPFKRNDACRYCGATTLLRFLSLGMHPPSNSFLREEDVGKEERYPLDVYWCQKCFLVQLLDVVPAEIIFDDYVYLASSSKALKQHYARLVEGIVRRYDVKTGDVVVDIGCNDGILLHGYPSDGFVRVGVEPSKVARLAADSGLEVVSAFFSPEVARQIVSRFGPAKVVTATNVFAHVDNIGRFVEGIPPLLRDDGVFVIEASYLMDLMDQNLADTIYHEHLCYLSLTPMVPFLSRYGLDVFDAEAVPFGASGPAIRLWVRKKMGSRPPEPSVADLLEREKSWGVGDFERYAAFAKRVEGVRAEILSLIERLRREGKRLGAFGAPAKGNTLLNYLGLDGKVIECVAENNRLKQGLLTPGSHIPIVSDEEFVRRMPDVALLLTWNYLDFFLQNSDYIKRGGKFIVPLPSPRIVP